MNDSGDANTISLDVEFGSIKFVREGSATYAVANVDVTVMDTSTTIENLVRMEIKFPARPEDDTILHLVATSRRLIVERLRSAATIIEGQSADELLFGESS